MVQILINFSIIVITLLLNLVGAGAVGQASNMLGVAILTPFVILSLIGGWRLRSTVRLRRTPAKGISKTHGFSRASGIPFLRRKYRRSPPQPQADFALGRYLAVLAWNSGGFDSIGNCAAEVRDAGRTLPRAMTITAVLVTGSYLLPVLVALPVLPDPVDWRDGAWVHVGSMMGGEWLGVAIGIGACLSALGMFSSLMFTGSRLIYGVALNGSLPEQLLKCARCPALPLGSEVLRSSLCALSSFPLSGCTPDSRPLGSPCLPPRAPAYLLRRYRGSRSGTWPRLTWPST